MEVVDEDGRGRGTRNGPPGASGGPGEVGRGVEVEDAAGSKPESGSRVRLSVVCVADCTRGSGDGMVEGKRRILSRITVLQLGLVRSCGPPAVKTARGPLIFVRDRSKSDPVRSKSDPVRSNPIQFNPRQ